MVITLGIMAISLTRFSSSFVAVSNRQRPSSSRYLEAFAATTTSTTRSTCRLFSTPASTTLPAPNATFVDDSTNNSGAHAPATKTIATTEEPRAPLYLAEGLFAVDKPVDWTSQDVVACIRGMLERDARNRGAQPQKLSRRRTRSTKRTIKVGHGGTLVRILANLFLDFLDHKMTLNQRYSHIILKNVGSTRHGCSGSWSGQGNQRIAILSQGRQAVHGWIGTWL